MRPATTRSSPRHGKPFPGALAGESGASGACLSPLPSRAARQKSAIARKRLDAGQRHSFAALASNPGAPTLCGHLSCVRLCDQLAASCHYSDCGRFSPTTIRPESVQRPAKRRLRSLKPQAYGRAGARQGGGCRTEDARVCGEPCGAKFSLDAKPTVHSQSILCARHP